MYHCTQPRQEYSFASIIKNGRIRNGFTLFHVYFPEEKKNHERDPILYKNTFSLCFDNNVNNGDSSRRLTIVGNTVARHCDVGSVEFAIWASSISRSRASAEFDYVNDYVEFERASGAYTPPVSK